MEKRMGTRSASCGHPLSLPRQDRSRQRLHVLRVKLTFCDLSSRKCHIIIIISAVHATAGRWPPQLTPCTSILSHSHPLTATNFPSPFGSPSYSFSFSGCPFWCYLGPPGVAHSGYMSCPLSSHAQHSITSFTSVLDLIISFRILSFFVMFNNNLDILRWATASFFSWCFVRAHVSAP